MRPMMTLMTAKAPKILAPIVCLANGIGGRCPHSQRAVCPTGGLWPLKDCRGGREPALFHPQRHAHGGMGMAAHLEGTGAGKGFIKVLARGFLLGVEQPVDVDLVDEAVFVGEGECFTSSDGHFGRVEG